MAGFVPGGLLVLGLVPHVTPAQEIDLDLGSEPRVVTSEDRRERRLGGIEVRENGSFAPGERLVYSVRYGIIRAGEATLEVGPPTSIGERRCHPLIGTAASNDFFSSVFSVNDRMESFLDTEYLLPWRFQKELHEGGYHAEQRVEMDQLNQTATYHDGEVVAMEPAVQDALSALYYLRTLELRPGTSLVIPTHADKKNVNLEVKVLGRERVETPAGDFDCLVVEPYILLDSGLYDHKKGKLIMYLTDDWRKMPVLFKIKVLFGSLVLTLTEARAGSDAHG